MGFQTVLVINNDEFHDFAKDAGRKVASDVGHLMNRHAYRGRDFHEGRDAGMSMDAQKTRGLAVCQAHHTDSPHIYLSRDAQVFDMAEQYVAERCKNKSALYVQMEVDNIDMMIRRLQEARTAAVQALTQTA